MNNWSGQGGLQDADAGPGPMNRTQQRSPVHISVCVCTYKRPLMLKQLISALNGQHTGGLFTYSIVIADNDEDQSGAAAVAESRMISSVPLKYCVEPRRSIALARNKVIENACGDYLALIDDDESPAPDWLLTLYKTCEKYQVEGRCFAISMRRRQRG